MTLWSLLWFSGSCYTGRLPITPGIYSYFVPIPPPLVKTMTPFLQLHQIRFGGISDFLFLLQTSFPRSCPSCCIDDSSHTGLPMQGFCQGDKRTPGGGVCSSLELVIGAHKCMGQGFCQGDRELVTAVRWVALSWCVVELVIGVQECLGQVFRQGDIIPLKRRPGTITSPVGFSATNTEVVWSFTKCREQEWSGGGVAQFNRYKKSGVVCMQLTLPVVATGAVRKWNLCNNQSQHGGNLSKHEYIPLCEFFIGTTALL